MHNVLMGSLDGNLERMAFNIHDIEHIITRNIAKLVSSNGDPGLLLELNGDVFRIEGSINKDEIKPFFIALKSGIAFNVSFYQILFNVKELPNSLISGTDSAGNQHLCKRFVNRECENWEEKEDLSVECIQKRIEAGDICQEEMESLKDVIDKLKKGEFYELLTMEFSGKIKGIAKELIEFRKDIQKKIEPDIVEIASKDIPEASNQLEGINETLEESTMKIMDINEGQMETAQKQLENLTGLLSRVSKGDGASAGLSIEETINVIENQIDILKDIKKASLRMMEPLSFQDLVGQRIQRIINLVRTMELRIEELIVSFGIRLKKHREDPTKSYKDLNSDVDAYMTGLKGPLRVGEGLDQAGIDDLLESL